MKAVIDYKTAMIAAWDAADRNMKKHGRKKWSKEDHSVAIRTFNKLYHGKPVMKSRRNPEDEEMSAYDEIREDINNGECYTISDGRGSTYELTGPKGWIGTYDDFNAAVKAIVVRMQRDNYYPSVYYVNDHGNIDVLSIRIGKRKVTWKTVASYV